MADQNKTGVVPQEVTDAMARLGAAASQAAGKIQSLKDQISQNMTAEEVTDLKNQIDSISAGLESAAADPAVQGKKK